MDQIPKISNSVKTAIVNEWMAVFPELKKYKPTKILCRRGPFLIGFEFIWGRANENYTPYYTIDVLILNDIGNLNGALLYSLKNLNGGPLRLNIETNSLNVFSEKKLDVREEVLKQCFVKFSEEVDIKEVTKKLLSEFQKEGKSLIASRYSTSYSLICLAGLLKKEDRVFADFVFEYALSIIDHYAHNDLLTNQFIEKQYNRSVDEVIRLFTDNYKITDYEKLVEQTIAKLKLEKF